MNPTKQTSNPTPWKPGSMYHAYIRYRLADGTDIEGWHEILILDARPGQDPHTARLLWEMVSATNRLPDGTPVWSTVWDDSWPERHVAGESVNKASAMTLTLRSAEPTGVYVPRDPRSNSLEVLRDYAIARVQEIAKWRDRHRPAATGEAATAYRAALAEADRAKDHLYEKIRADLTAGVNVYDMATTTGLSRERIYQIRDGRR